MLKTGIQIIKNDTYRIGRFTVVELADNKGHNAIGISRLSELDTDNDELGISIANGRAQRALYNKLNHKPVQYALMG